MKILRNIDHQFWLGVAEKCEYATFFHTPFWHRLATQTYSEYRDATVGVELGSGVRAVLPLIQTGKKGPFRNLASTFGGCYGGVIADGAITDEEARQIYEAACSGKAGRITITDNPLHGRAQELERFTTREDFTHLLALGDGFDTIYRNFSKGHRSAATQGERLGIKVRVGLTPSDYQAYYGAYEDSVSRWGDKATSKYPWELFENGHRLSQEHPETCKLWLAELNGRVIAGAWAFYWNKHVVWWSGAVYAEFFSSKPNNVLQVAIIKDACERGYAHYDLNPSGGHEGVVKFKDSFAAKRVPLQRRTYVSPYLEAGRRIRGLLRRR